MAGLIGAAAAISAAYRLVPPLEKGWAYGGFSSRPTAIAEAQFTEAIQAAERERREEIDSLREMTNSLRQIMLKQRVEIAHLQSDRRRRQLEQLHVDRRAQELERRRRYADFEARQFSELPVPSLVGSTADE